MAFAYDNSFPHECIDALIARLAERQYGLFTRRQAIDLGATGSVIHGRTAAGRWVRVRPAVYRLAGVPQSWRQRLLAVCLAGARASHLSAAALWRLVGFAPGPMEVIVPPGQRKKFPGMLAHEMSLDRADVAVTLYLPTTTPTRTLIDLAATHDPGKVEAAFDDALRRGITSIPRLRWRLSELGSRPGSVLIRSLIEARAGGIPQSVFETKVLRFLRDIGLPSPVCQYEIREGRDLIAVVDFAYPALRLAIEADGYEWHSGLTKWEHDLNRNNRLTGLGWRVIHVAWRALDARQDAVAHQITRAFES
jgi:hypothetical protein